MVTITKDNFYKYIFINKKETVVIYKQLDGKYQMRCKSNKFFGFNGIIDHDLIIEQCLHYLYANGYKVKKIEFEEVKED